MLSEARLGAAAPRAPLTPGERHVLALVLQGKTNQQVAKARGTSVRTVANQVASIFRKLNVQSRAELVARDVRGAGS